MPLPTSVRASVREAADRLYSAASSVTPVAPVRDVLGSTATSDAYDVQRANIERLVLDGDRVVGRKIGLTSLAVQRQLGVSQPDFGTLLSSMQIPHQGVVDSSRLLQPRIEAEVAFELADAITEVPGDPGELVRFIRRALPALEIVDSRIQDWDITILDTIADNASSGLFVLGEGALPLDLASLTAITMRMERNAVQVSAGRGSDCLGSPLHSLHWLASAMCAVGEPLQAGDIVLTGALGPMSAVHPGDVFTATFGDDQVVAVRFSKGTTS